MRPYVASSVLVDYDRRQSPAWTPCGPPCVRGLAKSASQEAILALEADVARG